MGNCYNIMTINQSISQNRIIERHVKWSQVAFNKNKWQSHEFYKHDEWKQNR